MYKQLNKNLLICVNNGYINTVKYLLENGADIHTENGKAIIRASFDNNIEIIKLLMEYGADIHAQNDDAIVQAVDGNDDNIIKLLIEYGADIHAQNDKVFISSIENRSDNITKFLASVGDFPINLYGRVSLSKIIDLSEDCDDNIDIIKLALENGANVHMRNDIAIITAVQNGMIDIVKILMEYGADINAQNNKAFKRAASNGKFKMIDFIINRYNLNIDLSTFKIKKSGYRSSRRWQDDKNYKKVYTIIKAYLQKNKLSDDISDSDSHIYSSSDNKSEDSD